MVSALDSGSSGSGSGSGLVLCSWARHFNSHGASLHSRVYMGAGEFNAGGNPAMD